jgi:hypothetical protein
MTKLVAVLLILGLFLMGCSGAETRSEPPATIPAAPAPTLALSTPVEEAVVAGNTAQPPPATATPVAPAIVSTVSGESTEGVVAPSTEEAGDPIRFAVIGDFGLAISRGTADVAALVKSWDPDIIITTGDNNYVQGSAETIDSNIGQFYHDYIYPYKGHFGEGAEENRFFPSLGNHDWNTPDAQPYLDYFELPGNERYYEFVSGPVHFFALDSDPREPDGTTSDSVQAQWLQSGLAGSTACWQVIYFHHPPHSSGPHATSTWMRWPFREWGGDAVLAGHDHIYERLAVDGLPYFVNGLGGSMRYELGAPVEGSQMRYNDQFGAMLVDATPSTITYQFITVGGQVIDTHTQSGGCAGS